MDRTLRLIRLVWVTITMERRRRTSISDMSDVPSYRNAVNKARFQRARQAYLDSIPPPEISDSVANFDQLGMPAHEKSFGKYEFPTGEGVTESTSELFSSGAGLIDNIATSITTNAIQNVNSQAETDALSSMPLNYAFQFTDRNNAKAAMDTYLTNQSRNLSTMNDIRGGLDVVANMFGPEIGVPYSILDATLGNALSADLFTSDVSSLRSLPYNKVRTYGDFGSSVNQDSGAPRELENSVNDFNG